jgi:hypothetical protein
MRLATSILCLCGVVLLAGSTDAGIIPGQSIGIDLSNWGNTPGAGSEVNFNVFNWDTTGTAAIDTTGAAVTGVTIHITGIGPNGGLQGEGNLGFAAAGVGDYTGTPFSDLSCNDGVWTYSSTLAITFSGLDDALTYDVLTVATAPQHWDSPGPRTTVDGTSLTRYYPAYYAGDTLNPLAFDGASTDGNGNLAITFERPGTAALNVGAVHLTAVGDTTVPEPSTLALAALGSLGMGLFVWRRRKR